MEFLYLSFAVLVAMEAVYGIRDEVPYALPGAVFPLMSAGVGLGLAALFGVDLLIGLASAGSSAMLRTVGLSIREYVNPPTPRRR